MSSYKDIQGIAWSDSIFTYSIDVDTAGAYLTSFDIDNPKLGNSAYVSDAINAWSAVANLTFLMSEDPNIGFYEADMPSDLPGRTYRALPGGGLQNPEIY